MTWQAVLPVALPAGAVVRSTAELRLEPEPRNVGVARRFVREQVADLPDDTREALLLLTSELVTNAVVHARTQVEVAVAVTDEDVVVMVYDLDLGRREQRSYDRDGGRGLSIVRALAVETGLLPHREGGKTAWFRISLAAGGAGSPTGHSRYEEDA
ncbi:MAG TPA: ATP-binding protein [Mycobacteriales bacterium]|jgi:two-component sensor histidine kinase|nr:ATP-binding protein [Mycobacteriales bacterium]